MIGIFDLLADDRIELVTGNQLPAVDPQLDPVEIQGLAEPADDGGIFTGMGNKGVGNILHGALRDGA